MWMARVGNTRCAQHDYNQDLPLELNETHPATWQFLQQFPLLRSPSLPLSLQLHIVCFYAISAWYHQISSAAATVALGLTCCSGFIPQSRYDQHQATCGLTRAVINS